MSWWAWLLLAVGLTVWLVMIPIYGRWMGVLSPGDETVFLVIGALLAAMYAVTWPIVVTALALRFAGRRSGFTAAVARPLRWYLAGEQRGELERERRERRIAQLERELGIGQVADPKDTAAQGISSTAVARPSRGGDAT